jgi:hypothetical protein
MILGDIVYRPSCQNIKLDMEFKNYDGWKHEIVFTGNDFVLVSTDPSETRYLTGFVDGVFKNEAGFVEDSLVEELKSKTAGVPYEEVLIDAKSAFFMQAYDLGRRNSVMFSLNRSEISNPDGTRKPLSEVAVSLSVIGLLDDYMTRTVNCRNTEPILHNYVEASQGDSVTDSESSAE